MGIPQFLEDVKAKKEVLMGFGHRVYKNYDPRAKAMKKLVDEVLAETNKSEDSLLGVAMELEKIALSDDYFITRKLYPNVDYYSGIMLRAIGIPQSMFTVLFAMSRTVGWCTQWNEMVQEKQMRISRPRQVYGGTQRREYVPRNKTLRQPSFDKKGRMFSFSKATAEGSKSGRLPEPMHVE